MVELISYGVHSCPFEIDQDVLWLISYVPYRIQNFGQKTVIGSLCLVRKQSKYGQKTVIGNLCLLREQSKYARKDLMAYQYVNGINLEKYFRANFECTVHKPVGVCCK